ncbi:MAG: hypothetical protein HYY30_02420 [Chloroflexi bacterium]|nr:hypothetical protein [Chloroflexota bacterium]
MNRNLPVQAHLNTLDSTPVSTRLLDRYVLPKVAMILIMISVAAGSWLSLSGIGAAEAGLIAAKWVHFLALSILVGGSLWGAIYARRSYEEHGIETPPLFLRLEFHGFATIQLGAAFAALVSGAYVLAKYSALVAGGNPSLFRWLIVLQGLLWLGIFAAVVIDRAKMKAPTNDWLRQSQRWLKLIALLAMLSLLVTAFADVIPRAGLDGPAILARWVHLGAFAVWFGGAIWNVFVAVPAARRSLSFETVFAAASQLDQFRRVVRVALPLVVATGLFQAYGWIGLEVSALASAPVGIVILIKLALIISLVGIFLACPMWRACSPIAGVCDITDIDPTPDAGSRTAKESPELVA